MIALDRRELGRFRAAARRCISGRARGPVPAIVLQQERDSLTLSATLEEMAIAWQLAGCAGPPERLVIPFSTLTAIEGSGGGKVTLETSASGRICCRWQDRGESKELEVEALPVDGDLPSSGKLHAVDATLLPALHACGQTASRDTLGRYALNRLQLRGQAGQVLGTDGRQLLVWSGFTFPFQDELLIPAVPIFGGKDLAGEGDVRLGRTTQHLIIAAGAWTVWLKIDTQARYPNAIAIVPNGVRMAKLMLDEADAEALLTDLQSGPTSQDEVVPVMLDFGIRPALRWPDGTPGRRGQVSLIRSVCSGPALAIAINPQYLARALALGFREVRGRAGESPVLFRDQHRSFVVSYFGSPASAAAESRALPAPASTTPFPSNGDEPMNPERPGNLSTDPSPSDEMLNPLAEAEGLRSALMEAGRRAGRLIVALRQLQKQRRALHTVWSSLKHLGIGSQEEP